MPLVTDIKTKIKAKLDTLVPATLGEVQEDDFKLNAVLDRDIGAYPCAILQVPSIQGGYLTNRQNIRTHTFEIAVILKGEDITSTTQVETLMEALIDAFDNDPMLTGTADGGVEPSSTAPIALTSRDRTFIVFTIVLKVKAIKTLTF